MRDRVLRYVASAATRRPGATLAVAIAVTLLAALVLPSLRIDTSHSGLYDADASYARDWERFLERFGSPNQLVVMVEGADEASRRRFLDLLRERLPARTRGGDCEAEAGPNAPGCVDAVLAKLDIDQVGERALLYAPREAVERLAEQLETDELGLRRIRALTGLRSLFDALAELLEARGEADLPTGRDVDAAREAMRSATRFVDELARRVREPGRAGVSIEQALFQRSGDAGVDTAGYLSSDDGSIKVGIVRASHDTDAPEHVLPFVGYVREQAREVAAEVSPELVVRATGLPAVIADEAGVLWTDLLYTSVLATAAIFAILLAGLGSLGPAILCLLPLGLALVGSLAFAQLAFGGLNMVTTAVVPILLGLCIDFGVHLLSRFNEGRAAGRSVEEAAWDAVVHAGPPMLTGALTTSGAFVALAVSDFQAFREMGIITGFGLLWGLGLTLTVLPAMLCHPRLAFLRGRRPPPSYSFLAGLPALVVRRRVAIVLGALLLAGWALASARAIPWSYDYADLLPAGTESTEGLRLLTERTDFSGEVAAVEVGSVEQARAVAERLGSLPTVARVESLATYLPSEQEPKLAAIRRLAPQLRTPLGSAEPLELDPVRAAIERVGDALEDAEFEAKRAGSEMADILSGPKEALRGLLRAIDETPAAEVTARLAAVQQTFLDARDRGMRLLAGHVDAAPLDAAELLRRLPPEMRNRLAHPDGALAVYIYPRESIGDRAYLTQLVADMRSAAPRVTGLPVTHLESMEGIRVGVKEASLLSLALVFALLLLDFRSLRHALLSLFPLGIGLAWSFGGVHLLGVRYNAGNVIGLPLLLGIAVDSGVHLLHRYRVQGERDLESVVRHTGRAVALSALTTGAGFAALIAARHRAMNSFGEVLVVGVSACLVSAVVCLPALLRLVGRSTTAPGR